MRGRFVRVAASLHEKFNYLHLVMPLCCIGSCSFGQNLWTMVPEAGGSLRKEGSLLKDEDAVELAVPVSRYWDLALFWRDSSY